MDALDTYLKLEKPDGDGVSEGWYLQCNECNVFVLVLGSLVGVCVPDQCVCVCVVAASNRVLLAFVVCVQAEILWCCRLVYRCMWCCALELNSQTIWLLGSEQVL